MKAIYNLFRLTIISSGKWILIILVTHLLIGGLFHIKYFRWHVYMMYGYILISFITSFYFNKEFKSEIKYFIYSLPLKRETVVYFRYLLSFILFVVCLSIWFLNGYLFDMLWDEKVTYFNEIYYSKVVFMALFFYVIQQSLFLPAAFVYRMQGIVISFVIGLSIAITTIPVIFYPYSYRYSRYFHQQDLGLITLLSMLMIFLITGSIYISHKLNINRDL